MNKQGKYLEYLKKPIVYGFCGIEAGSEENLRSVFYIEMEPDEVLKEASSDNTSLAQEETELARVKRMLAAIFLMKNEIFWGDDRLEDAIRYTRR